MISIETMHLTPIIIICSVLTSPIWILIVGIFVPSPVWLYWLSVVAASLTTGYVVTRILKVWAQRYRGD